MKSPEDKRARGVPALELLEEATALIKGAPAALLIYYLSSVPFVIGLLYYWAEMSGSSDASRRVSAGAIGMALLFVLMKTGQSRFACALRDQLAPGLDEPWTLRRWVKCAAIQGIWQPWGLLALPASALITIPFPHVYAFFQNLLLTGNGLLKWREAGAQAWRLSRFWPRQNFIALLILFLFGLVVYLNGWILILIVPALIKMLLGFESVFTRGGYAIFNSTFMAATVCFAYLALDPLFKAVYVLRCFYAESRHTGVDLQVGLKKLFASPTLVAALLLLALVLPASLRAQDTPVEPPATQEPVAIVPPPELDKTIQDVLTRREYRWRLPPLEEEQGPEERGFLSKMLADFFDGLRSIIRDTLKWLDSVWDRIQRWLDQIFDSKPKDRSSNSESSWEWLASAQMLAFVLLAAVCAVVAVFLVRHFRKRGKAQASAALYTGAIKAPDLEDEHLLASELPEDEWLKLGDEMARRGERRLALRAYYLAVIARLSARELLTVALYKTNRDYARELRRRARGREDLQESFGTVMTLFERVWYGEHPVGDELWNLFEMKRRFIFAPAEEAVHA